MSEFLITLSEAPDPLPEHLPEILRLFDEATLWLVSLGRTEQWGRDAPSHSPPFVQRIAGFLERSQEQGMTIILARADKDEPIIGIIAFDEAPTPGGGTPPAVEREVYVHLLLTTRDQRYRGLGLRLFEEAKTEARRRDINLLRLSCFAGGDGKLIQVYEKMGLRKNPDEVIFVPSWDGSGPWPKVVMEMRLESTSG